MTRTLILFFCSVLILLTAKDSIAQTAATDSVKRLLTQKNLHDTSRVKLLLGFVEVSNNESEWMPYNREADHLFKRLITTSQNDRLDYFYSQVVNNYGYFYHVKGMFDSAVYFYSKAAKLLDKPGYEKAAVVILSNMAGIYNAKGEAVPALSEYKKCLEIRKKIGDTAGVGRSHYHIGMCYKMLGQIQKTTQHYDTSLRIFQKLGNLDGQADALSGIGSILDDQGNYDEALRAFRESYNLYSKINDVTGMLVELNNIGKAHSNKGESDSAIFYYKLVIKRRLETNNEYGLANSYGNIASEYGALGNLDLALIYYNKSYEIHKRINALEGLGLICSGIAWTHYKQGDPSKALPYIKEGISVGENVSNPEILMNLHSVAYKIYESLNDYRQAHEHFKKFKLYEDSLVNMSTKEAALKGQMQYEYDKKELLLKSENEKSNLMQKQEISKQRWIIFSVVGGLVIVLLFSLFLYNRFKIIRRQKHIIEHQKELVEEKQKEILDSIKYARRIQQSLLPNDTYISKSLRNKSKV